MEPKNQNVHTNKKEVEMIQFSRDYRISNVFSLFGLGVTLYFCFSVNISASNPENGLYNTEDTTLHKVTIHESKMNLSGPANISNGIKLWLDASDPDGDGNPGNNPSDGSNINTWTDISGNGNDATVLVGQNAPVYGSDPDDLINGSPVMKFTRITDNLGSVLEVPNVDIRTSSYEDVCIITVYKQGAINAMTDNQGLWGVDDGGFDRFYLTNYFPTQEGGVSVGFPTGFVDIPNSGIEGLTRLLTVNYDGGAGNANGTEIFFDGKLIETVTDNTHPTFSKPTFRIGFDGDNSAYNGDIAEVIVYCRKLTACEIEEISIYLGDKYGTNFIDLSVHYEFDANYGNDINGIGQLVTTACGAILTIDEAESNIVTIDNPSSNNTTDEFITLGHDGGGFGATNLFTYGFDERLTQVWRIDEDGDLGTVDICFDLMPTGITPAIPCDFALLIDPISSFFSNSSTIITDGVTISGNSVCFSGIDFNHGDHFSLATSRRSGLQLWFSADEGVKNNGSPVTNGTADEWENRGRRQSLIPNIIQNNTSFQPSIQSDLINFNPAVTFDGTNDFLNTTGHSGACFLTQSDNTVFVVSRFRSSSGVAIQVGDNQSNHLGFNINGTKGQYDFPNDTDGLTLSNTNILNNFNINGLTVDGATNIYYLDGQIDNTVTTTSTINFIPAFDIYMGKQVLGNSLYADVDIAEVMIFDELLNPFDREIIESALALKYGIPLNQGVSGRNYRGGNGAIIWDGPNCFGYSQNVAGIGIGGFLNQKQTKSIASDAIITIGLGTIANDNASNPNNFLLDNRYMIWGHNGGLADSENTSTDVPGQVDERMTRLWKIEENNGDVGLLEVQFNLDGLGYDVCYEDVNDYYLLIDTDTDFSNATAIVAASLNNEVVTFTDIDFSDGDFFTIGFNVIEPGIPSLSGNDEICIGESTTLMLSGILNQADDWHWYAGTCGTNPVGTGTSITVSPTTTTTFYARGEGSCLVEAGMCGSLTVIVHPSPVIVVSNNGPVCENATVVLQETGNEAISWSWSGPNGFSSNLQVPIILDSDPSDSGNYSVTITDINGCTNTMSTDVVVNPLPTAIVSSNSPICETEDLLLFESGGDGITWAWGGPNGFSSFEQNPVIPNATPLNSGTYGVSVIDANCYTYVTLEVMVNPTPNVNTSSNSPLCEGESIELTEDGGDAINWQWTGPNGFSSSNQNPTLSNASPSQNGTYTVVITDANGCTHTASEDITVFPKPTTSVFDNSPICQFENIVMSVSGGAATSWQWSGPNGFSGSGQSVFIPNATVAMAGIYTVTITDGNGCTNSYDVNMVINTGPTSNPDYVTPACTGGDLQLMANTTGALFWEWTGPNNFTSSQQNPVINNVTLASAGTYTLTATDGNLCASTASVDVQIGDPIAIAENDGPSCAGTNLTLMESGGTAVSWQWSGPNNFASSLQNPILNNAQVSDSGTYSVQITDALGCTKVASTVVTIAPDFTPVIATNAPICEGEDLMLSESSGQGVNWFWSGPNNFASSFQNNTLSNATIIQNGTYFVTTTNAEGCSKTASIGVVIYDKPISEALSDSPGCEGDNIQLEEIGGDAQSWSWLGPNGYSVSEQNPIISNVNLTMEGVYTVTITDANGCTNSAFTNVVVLNLPEIILSSNSPVAVNGTIELVEAGSDGQSWSWLGPDFLSNEQSPDLVDAQLSDSGTYSVTVTGTNGCTNTDQIEVIVTDALALAKSNSPLCEGADLELSEEAGFAESWQWSGPNGFTSNEQNPILSNANTINAGTYSVSITLSNGTTATSSVDVVINSTPQVNIPQVNAPCEGSNLTLMETGGEATMWQWTGENNFTSSEQNPTILNTTQNDEGAYSVLITDANGCTNEASIDIEIESLPNIQANSNTPICEGENLNLMETGGEATMWQWTGANNFSSNDQNPVLNDIDISAAGDYTIVITDANGCTNESTLTVDVFDKPAVVISIVTPPCENSSTTLFETGGAATEWEWTSTTGFNSNEQDAVLSNLTLSDSGTYEVLITDDNGCQNSETLNLQVNSAPAAEASTSGAACENQTVTLMETGGDAINWQWMDSAGFISSDQNPVLDNIQLSDAGTYSVIVTGNNGCTSEATTTVLVNGLPTVGIDGEDAICEGETLMLTEHQGAAVDWLWTGPNNFSSDAQQINIPNTTSQMQGNYIVVITGTNGCTNEENIDIQINAKPSVAISIVTPPCENSSTTLFETGDDAVEWEWTSTTGYNSTAQNAVLSNLALSDSGTYEVLITDDNGCQNSETLNLQVNPAPIAEASTSGAACESQAVTLMETGGDAINWEWMSSTGFNSTDQNPMLDNIQFSDAGTYAVIVTDDKGCTSEATTTVLVNTLPTVGINGEDAICEGDALILTENQGAAVDWSWTGPNSFSSDAQQVNIPNTTTQMEGNYTVVITGGNGCTNTENVDIQIFTKPIISAMSNGTICAGDAIQLSESGGDANEWTWSGPNGFGSNAQNPIINNATVAASGTYTIEIKNMGSCSNTQTVDVMVNSLPNAELSSNSPVVAGGNLNLFESAGNGSNWTWSGPNGYSSNTQNPTISGVSATEEGTYFVTVTDDNGCSQTSSTEVYIITSPIAIGSNSPLCEGENLELSEFGGMAVDWSWSGPNGFSSNAQNPFVSNVSNVEAGTYALTITVNTGGTFTADLDVEINQNPIIDVDSSTDELCAGGNFQLTESGGIATEWLWTGPGGFASADQNPTYANANSDASGTYLVIATTTEGCTATDMIDITVFDTPMVNIQGGPVLCEGANLSLNESGGDATGWLWTGVNNFSSTHQNPLINNATLNATGSYSVIVTDANNCTAESSLNITVNALPSATVSSNAPLCEAETLQLFETEGDGTNWSWVGPDGLNSTAQNPLFNDIMDSASGFWSVTVTDGNGCSITASTDVTIETQPQMDIQTDSEICLNETIQFMEAGGEATQWLWMGPNSFTSTLQNPTLNNATAQNEGLYQLQVTGSNGCTNQSDISIEVQPLPTVNLTSNVPCENADLQLEETAGDATGWMWTGPNSFSSTVQNPLLSNITSLAAGTYFVTVTDANDCQNEDDILITVNANPGISLSSNAPVCEGENLQLFETAGDATQWSWIGPNSFSSNNSSPILTAADLNASGAYEVIVTAANGCTATDNLDIAVNALPAVSIDNLEDAYCNDDMTTVLITGTPTNGNYSINPSMGLNDLGNGTAELLLANLNAGDFEILYFVTDVNDCSNEVSQMFTKQAPLAIQIDVNNTTPCEGEDLQLSETGGDATQWSWMGAGGLSFNGQNWTISGVDLMAMGAYEVTITDVNDCSATASVNIDVQVAPDINITTNAPLCEGEDLQLADNGGDAVQWTWIGPNGFNETTQNTGITGAMPNASGDYMLEITGANGCTSSATQNIVINSLPDVAFLNLEPGYCVNTGAQIIINTNQTSGIFSFTGGNGVIDLGNGSVELFPGQLVAANYQITFLYTDANGCTNQTTEVFDIYPSPNVVAETDGQPCAGEEFFTLMETGGDVTDWFWFGPGGFSSTEQNPTLSNSVGVEGTYEVIGSDANGCLDTAMIDIEMVLGESFISNFLITNQACVGDSVKMIEVSETTLEPTAFQWDFGDGNTSTERDPFHIYQNPGSYLVQVEVFDEECGNLSLEKTIEIENCRKLNLEGEGVIKSRIFPNPSMGEFKFQMEILQRDNVVIEIYDPMGKLMEKIIKEQVLDLEKQFYLEQPGIYFLNIRLENFDESKILKIIVLK